MFSAYWPGDFFAYGTTEDMLRYWDCELSDEDLDRYNLIDRFRENGDSYRQREESGLVPEVIIQESFFKRMGDPIGEFNIKSFWERAKRQFIFISGEDVQLFFPKYLSRYDTTEKMGLYCSNDSPNVCLTYNWNFMRWFNLYSGVLEYRSEYEAIHENPRS